MAFIEKGRNGVMIKEYKSDDIRDLMRVYFNHPVWNSGIGDPVSDMPLDLQIELVNKCNLSCTSCNYPDQIRDVHFLDWGILKRIVDEAAEEGIAYFTICGIGEATLHPDLFKLLKYIRNKTVKPSGLRIFNRMLTVLISNGDWTDEVAQKCIDSPPDVLSFSLAGLKDEDIIERRQGIDLEKFINNISYVYNNRHIKRDLDKGILPVIHVSTHIFPKEMENNDEDITNFREKWFQYSDAIVIKPTVIEPLKADTSEFISGNKILDEKLIYTDISENKYMRTSPCFETSRRLAINSDGKVWCGHFLSEKSGKYLGDINKQSLREIWHSDEMNKFRLEVRSAKFTRTSCKRCGGELREVHRTKPENPEDLIYFTS